MGKKRGGDGTKGEEGEEERAKKGDAREGVSEWRWKAQQHALVSAPQAEQAVGPRNERRAHAVVWRRWNRGASVGVGCDVHGEPANRQRGRSSGTVY
jgi:hypothetical protein